MTASARAPRDEELPPFWSLVEEHAPALLRHARQLSGSDAEDVVQEALLRALRSYPQLEHGNHLRAWLYRITTTTAFDLSSTRGRTKEVLVPQVPDRGGEGFEVDVHFEELISGLPSGARAAVELRFVHDLPFEQIGARLGCSTEAARQRVSGAIKRLRRKMP